MRVVADSHTIVWFTQRSRQLSDRAAGALRDAARSEGITVSVATFVDLWYVTQTTQAVTSPDLARLRAVIERSRRVDVHSLDLDVADAYTAISRLHPHRDVGGRATIRRGIVWWSRRRDSGDLAGSAT